MKNKNTKIFLGVLSVVALGFGVGLAGCSDDPDVADGGSDASKDSTVTPDGDEPKPDAGDSAVEPTCTPITIAGWGRSLAPGPTLNKRISASQIQPIGLPIDGGTPPADADASAPQLLDRAHFDLTGGATGTFNLGSTANQSTETCTECLYLFEDFEAPPGPNFTIKHGYMPDRGTATVTTYTVPDGGTLISKGSFSNVRFREVLLDKQGGVNGFSNRGTSTLVPNGKCYTVATSTWDFPAPVADGGGDADAGDAGDADAAD